MDDFDLSPRPITKQPEKREEEQPALAPGESLFDLAPRNVREAPKKAEPEADWAAVAKSGAMKAPIAATFIGGDIQDLLRVAPQLGVQAYDWMRERLPSSWVKPRSEEEKARSMETAKRMSGYIEERQQTGPLPGLGLPWARPVTSEEVSQAVQPYAEKAFGVGPATEFELPRERIVREGIAGLATGVGAAPRKILPLVDLPAAGVAGPLRGLGRRASTGFAGGAGAQSGQEYAKGTVWEVPASLAGAVLGQKGAQAAQRFSPGRGLIPELGATERLAQTLGDYGAESSAAARRMAQTPEIAQAAAELPSRMRTFTQRSTGVDPKSVEYAKQLEEIGSIERDRVYDLARGMPNAGQITDPTIDALRESNPLFRKAEKLAIERGQTFPESWDIKPPVNIPEVPEGKWKQTSKGMVFEGPQQAVPAQTIPGNLNYYDQVKKELDGIIEQAKRQGDQQGVAAAQSVKTQLLGVLDNAVPEYKAARGVASDTFRAASAPEAGARFLTTFDDFDKQQFIDAFRTYTPEQKRAFQVGLLGQLEKDFVDNPKRVTNSLLNKDFSEKLQLAFGPEIGQAIRAKALSENLIMQADKLRQSMASKANVETAAKTGFQAGKAGAATTGAALTTYGIAENVGPIMNFLAQMGVTPGTLTASLIGGAVAATGVGTFNRIESTIANQMVNLAKQDNPRAFAKLNQLIDNHPQVYNKLIVPVQAVNTALEEADRNPDVLYRRKHGGRIARKAGGRISAETEAERLVRAAESAKKNIGKGTEEILNAPDERVVKALKVANEQFEG